MAISRGNNSSGSSNTGLLIWAPCPPPVDFYYSEFSTFASQQNLTDLEIDIIAKRCKIPSDLTTNVPTTLSALHSKTTANSGHTSFTNITVISSGETSAKMSSIGTGNDVLMTSTTPFATSESRITRSAGCGLGCIFGILLATVLIVTAIVIFMMWKRRRNTRLTYLPRWIGPCKTKLCCNKFRESSNSDTKLNNTEKQPDIDNDKKVSNIYTIEVLGDHSKPEANKDVKVPCKTNTCHDAKHQFSNPAFDKEKDRNKMESEKNHISAHLETTKDIAKSSDTPRPREESNTEMSELNNTGHCNKKAGIAENIINEKDESGYEYSIEESNAAVDREVNGKHSGNVSEAIVSGQEVKSDYVKDNSGGLMNESRESNGENTGDSKDAVQDEKYSSTEIATIGKEDKIIETNDTLQKDGNSNTCAET